MTPVLALALVVSTAMGCAPAERATAAEPTSVADAGPDAGVRGSVTVTVYAAGGVRIPSAGAPVVFIDPDGTTTRRMTGIDGKATADVMAGATVSAIWRAPSDDQVQTIFGVEPGDELTMAGTALDMTEVGHYTVAWPSFEGATHYRAYTSCGDSYVRNKLSIITSMYAHCVRDKLTVAVAAFNNTGFLGFLEQPNVTYVAGGTTILSGSWDTGHPFQTTSTSLDPALDVNLELTRHSGVRGFSASTATPITSATQQLSIVGPTSTDTFVETTISDSHGARQHVHQRVDGGSLAYDLNVEDHRLPWLSMPTIHAATNMVVVLMDRPSRAIDAAAIAFTFHRTRPTRWVIVAPSLDGPITLPRLPDELADLLPRDGDRFLVGTALVVANDGASRYAALRGDLFEYVNAPLDHVDAGTLRISEYIQ